MRTPTVNEYKTDAQDENLRVVQKWLNEMGYSYTIQNLKNMRQLHIGNNRDIISYVPPEIGDLENLIILDINNSSLSELPSEIGDLYKLKELLLNNNKLTSIPPQIGNLINLEVMNIDNNRLTALPNEITNLDRLETIDAQGNDLLYLPENNLEHLKELKYLNVENNPNLKSLPENIGNIPILTRIEADWNNLTTLPESLFELYDYDLPQEARDILLIQRQRRDREELEKRRLQTDADTDDRRTKRRKTYVSGTYPKCNLITGEEYTQAIKYLGLPENYEGEIYKDPILMEPIHPDNFFIMDDLCYDRNSLSEWIESFKDRTKLPTNPLNNKEIPWDIIDQLGFDPVEFRSYSSD
jgi:Leucine-rich repeat (LRR) protein